MDEGSGGKVAGFTPELLLPLWDVDNLPSSSVTKSRQSVGCHGNDCVTNCNVFAIKDVFES